MVPIWQTEWASWVFSLAEVWQDDAPMQDRPLELHCSGLGGGLLSGEHEHDIFLQNLAQTKVYGPSLAMTDDWEEHITQLGITKTVHEYVIYQPLSTVEGWTAWQDFLPGQFADQQLLLTRAIRLIEAANIRPAHARPTTPDLDNSNYANLSLLPSARQTSISEVMLSTVSHHSGSKRFQGCQRARFFGRVLYGPCCP